MTDERMTDKEFIIGVLNTAQSYQRRRVHECATSIVEEDDIQEQIDKGMEVNHALYDLGNTISALEKMEGLVPKELLMAGLASALEDQETLLEIALQVKAEGHPVNTVELEAIEARIKCTRIALNIGEKR